MPNGKCLSNPFVSGLFSRQNSFTDDFYSKNPEKMPEEFLSIANDEGVERAVCDYIAGMSDNYSVKIFNQLFVPMFWME